MAHQCLKCGRSYPDGSPQILKGCEGCQGTRFFYTESPIGEKEREELAARTQDELGSQGQELPRRDRRIPTKGELPVGEDRDWVSMGPGNLRTIVEDVVRRSHEKKPTFRVSSDPSKRPPSLEEWVQQRKRELEGVGGEKTQEDHRGDERSSPSGSGQEGDWPPWPDASTKKEQPDPLPAARKKPSEPQDPSGRTPKEDVVYRRSQGLSRPASTPVPTGPTEAVEPGGPSKSMKDRGAEVPRRRGDPGELQAENAASDAEGTASDPGASESGSSLVPAGRPETVEVLEQGVYDLDVRRLLEKNPIVVHKDGSYSLHLPSLMESLEKKRR